MATVDDILGKPTVDDILGAEPKDGEREQTLRDYESKLDAAGDNLRAGTADIAKRVVMPSLNEGLANLLGLPVDTVNSVLRAVGLPMADKPVGGSESIKRVMESGGVNATPQPTGQGEQFISDVSRGVGMGGPFGVAGAVSGALSGAGEFVGREVGRKLGGETGAKVGALVGGVGGGLVPSAIKSAAKITAPANPKEVAMLEKGGVRLTPAQVRGGEFQRAEQGSQSMPIVGASVTKGLDDAADSYVTATINRAMEPIGQTLPPGVKAGHEAVDHLVRATSDAYDDVLPMLKVIRDPAIDRDIVAAITENLPGSGRVARKARETFSDIVNNRAINNFDTIGTMSGKEWKKADSWLGKEARAYARSDSPAEQAIGAALKDVQVAWRNMIVRTNPEQADTLNRINQAYAMQLRIEAAAAAAKHNGGRFTPGQLETALTAKAFSTTRQSARGDALLQDWAKAGELVLGGRVPDSGTPFRSALMGLTARPVSGAAAVGTAFGLREALNAGLVGSQRLRQMKTTPQVPVAFGASLLTQ